ncbi:retrovirus-related pol polyprotein from transposon TNT 1-94, partial [Tanacetum coccineum]
MYDSIKNTRVHSREQASTLLNKIESLKAQLKSKVSCVTSDSVKPKVLAPGMYAIDANRSAHLNYINHLKESVETVREIVEEARLKFEKDHFCSACQLGKSKKYSHKPKSENTNMEVLHTLHMDLCGSMIVQSINGKKYILVIVDDYSRFTWVKFLGLNKTVRYIRTDNGTEFVNQ